jgi:hypothetical protein
MRGEPGSHRQHGDLRAVLTYDVEHLSGDLEVTGAVEGQRDLGAPGPGPDQLGGPSRGLR